MKIKTLSFVSDFTDCPGGRHRVNSDKSGEEFREDILIPAFDSNERVVLNLNGAFGYPSSFLDEVFGKLVDMRGEKSVREKLEIVLNDDPVSLREIEEIIENHAKLRK